MTDIEADELRLQLALAEEQIAELKVALQNSLVAREVAEKTAEINAERELDVSRELKAFAHAVGHDLRNPLRSILTSAQLLDRRHPDMQQVKEYTAYIVEGAQEIGTLVDELMRFAKAGKSLRLSTLSLKLPIDLATYKVQALLKENKAQVTVGEMPEVSIDEAQFTTVFENLLINSARYRSAEAPQIRISAEERDSDYVVSVSDNGCGIEEKYQLQVFEPLKRLHGKQIPGMGLGLAICQKVIRAHGGTIWVESDGEHGSNFKFTVPL